MEIEIDYFKKTGKYQTSNTITLPDNTLDFEVRTLIRKEHNKDPYYSHFYAVSKTLNGVPFLILPKE